MLADRSINHQHSREYRYYGAQSVIPMTEEWDSSLSIECGQRTLLSLYKYTLTRTRTLKAVEGKVEGGGEGGGSNFGCSGSEEDSCHPSTTPEVYILRKASLSRSLSLSIRTPSLFLSLSFHYSSGSLSFYFPPPFTFILVSHSTSRKMWRPRNYLQYQKFPLHVCARARVCFA